MSSTFTIGFLSKLLLKPNIHLQKCLHQHQIVLNRSNILIIRTLRNTLQQSIKQTNSQLNATTIITPTPTRSRSYLGIFRRFKRDNQQIGNKLNQSNSTKPTPVEQQTAATGEQLGIFRRFKDAYKQHGYILIGCHFVLCCVWICALYSLAKSGFDIKKLFDVLETVHIMSHETSEGIIKKIETFNLEKFLRDYHFDYVLSDSNLEWIGKSITGVTLKHMIVAVMLYKIFTPLRYITTLAFAKIFINRGRVRGTVPPIQITKEINKELFREGKRKASIFREKGSNVGKYLKSNTKDRYSATSSGGTATTSTPSKQPPPPPKK